MSQIQIIYENNLSLLESLSKYEYFSYLNNFVNILERLNKLHILKSSKYNINIPVKSEVDKLVKFEKNNNTPNLFQLLMRLIKPTKSSFNVDNCKMIIINLNNNSKCYVRLLLFENKIKKVINEKHLVNIPDIYSEYKSVYPYVNDNFVVMNTPINDEDILNIFNELLHVNKYINEVCMSHKNVNYYDLYNNEFILIDKSQYIDKETKFKTVNDDMIKYNLDIQNRIDIFDKLLQNIKKTNDPKKYIEHVLNELRSTSNYNLFDDDNSDISKKKKKKKMIYYLINCRH